MKYSVFREIEFLHLQHFVLLLVDWLRVGYGIEIFMKYFITR
jgi:hypothetical protein